MMRRDRLARSLLNPINPSVIIIPRHIYRRVGFVDYQSVLTVFSQAPLYSAMAGIGSEYFWGMTAIIFGSVTIRGALKPSYSNLHYGAFAATLHWFVIAMLYFIGDWTSTGGITSLTFAVYSALIWVNIKFNKNPVRRVKE